MINSQRTSVATEDQEAVLEFVETPVKALEFGSGAMVSNSE